MELHLLTLAFVFSFCSVVEASSSDRYEDVTTQDEYGQEMIIRRLIIPTCKPTNTPSNEPSHQPSSSPTNNPTAIPTSFPSLSPTRSPTKFPTIKPTKSPTTQPTFQPTNSPTDAWDSITTLNQITSKRTTKSCKKFKEQESKLLKQTLETTRKAKLKSSKCRPDTIELYNYDVDISPELVVDFETKLIKNSEKKYSLIIFDGPRLDFIAESENILSCTTALDNALYNQVTLMHKLINDKLSKDSLFENGIKSTVSFMAKLDDQSIYDSIIQDFDDSIEYQLDLADNTFDGTTWYLLNEGYRRLRKQLQKSKTAALEQIGLHGQFEFNNLHLVTIINKISLKHLVEAKINYIEGIFTNTTYGNDGKIPIKVKNILSDYKSTAGMIISQQLPKLQEHLLWIYTFKSMNMSDEEIKSKINAHSMARKISNQIHEFCDELSSYCVCLQTTKLIYEWRKADKKQNHGTIAVISLFDKNEKLNHLLNNIGYTSSAVQEFMVYRTEKGHKGIYEIRNFSRNESEQYSDIDRKSKHRRKRNTDKNDKQTLIKTEKQQKHIDNVNIQIFVTDGDQQDIIRQEIKIANSKEFDFVMVEYGTSIKEAEIKKDRIGMETCPDFVFERSYNILTKYKHGLIKSDLQHPQARQDFIQETINFVSIAIFYFSQYADSDILFSCFIQGIKSCKSVNEKFIKVVEWQYSKKAKVDETYQKIEILRPNMMDNHMMKSAFDFISVYMIYITQIKINQLNSNLKLMAPELFKTHQPRISANFAEIMLLMRKWGTLVGDYWMTNDRIVLQEIDKRTTAAIALAPQLTKIKRFLETVTGINQWTKSRNQSVIALAMRESIFDPEFLELLQKEGYQILNSKTFL